MYSLFQDTLRYHFNLPPWIHIILFLRIARTLQTLKYTFEARSSGRPSKVPGYSRIPSLECCVCVCVCVEQRYNSPIYRDFYSIA